VGERPPESQCVEDHIQIADDPYPGGHDHSAEAIEPSGTGTGEDHMNIEKLAQQEATTLSDTELDQVTGGHAGEAVLNYINATAEKVIRAVQHVLR
jgi:bacteriocin-like protein